MEELTISKIIFLLINCKTKSDRKEAMVDNLEGKNFDAVVEIASKNKVRLPLILELEKYPEMAFVKENLAEIIKVKNADRKRIDKLIALRKEIDSMSQSHIFIKGTVLRDLYEEYYPSMYYRFSNDIDLLFMREEMFWQFIEKANNRGFVQDEAMYITLNRGVKDFITVHYKKKGVRVDLHCLSFPIQLFCNLEIDYDEKWHLENNLLILLAHSVSHEIITIRDLLDFELLMLSKANDSEYFIRCLNSNHLEPIYKKYFELLNQIQINNLKREDDREFPYKIGKKTIYSVLHRKRWRDVLNIRRFDFVFRKVIAHSKINDVVYKKLIRVLKPKKLSIRFLLNMKHFDISGEKKDLANQKLFDDDEIVEKQIKIDNTIYLVNEDLHYGI